MRDDIHKKVPRPRSVQRWVKRAINDADREHGRSLIALEDAIADTCRREISNDFRRGLLRRLREPGLLAPLGDVHSPRDLGSTGGHLENDILSDAKRFLASGLSPERSTEAALAGALKRRVESDIRATAPVLIGTKDPKARAVLEQMRRDATSADYQKHVRLVLGTESQAARPIRSNLDPDEDMRSSTFVGERR